MAAGTQRFGELLVELGLVTARQVEEALSLQPLTGNRIGEALISLGYLTRVQMQRAMATAIGRGSVIDLERPPLGEILVGLGILSEADLNRALELQRHDGRRLGELLIETKMCTHQQVYEAIGLQQRMTPASVEPPRTVTGEIPMVGRRRVFVIDDSELACMLVSEGLKAQGYDVAAFSDPYLALEQLQNLAPDMVLTDLDMPGIGGAELCRRLKTSVRRALPVIVLTASDDESARVALLRAGADDFVNKGASMEELAARIESVLRRTNEALHIKKLFARYTSDAVVDEVLKAGDVVLTGEQREITVVFADVRNFTTFAESHGPAEVMAQLNEVLSLLADAVMEHQGTLDKFLGDGLMAMWGAPVRHDDDALLAVRACQAMVRAVSERNTRRGGVPLRVGVGINTGLAIVGSVGNARRTEYTCIGDTVNVASRLCALAGPDEIVIGEKTAAQLAGQVRCEPMNAVTLKGKAQPVTPFRVR